MAERHAAETRSWVGPVHGLCNGQDGDDEDDDKQYENDHYDDDDTPECLCNGQDGGDEDDQQCEMMVRMMVMILLSAWPLQWSRWE